MTHKLKTTLLLVAGLFFATSCNDFFEGPRSEIDLEQSKKGKKTVTTSEDEDSDRPDWAGGNPEENPHIRGNDDSGTTRGGEYGDLYTLLRDPNGVPVMRQLDNLEWYVQPIDEYGNTLELDAEGELVHPELASEVEFGRLNIVRSPQNVLDQALDESMKVLAAPGAEISLDFCGRLTSTYPDPATDEIIVKTIDSPRESMALYQYLMIHMFENTAENNYNNRLRFLGEDYGYDPLEIAASCFAAGSDKTGTIDLDEVVYINGFIQCIGLNPILNEHEFTFGNEQKYYFNWEDCLGDGMMSYKYSRQATYQNRYLRLLVYNGKYYEPDDLTDIELRTHSILDYMEDHGLFTNMWDEGKSSLVSGFAIAADDAVQVLDLIHGDSNIIFDPDYVPTP